MTARLNKKYLGKKKRERRESVEAYSICFCAIWSCSCVCTPSIIAPSYGVAESNFWVNVPSHNLSN